MNLATEIIHNTIFIAGTTTAFIGIVWIVACLIKSMFKKH